LLKANNIYKYNELINTPRCQYFSALVFTKSAGRKCKSKSERADRIFRYEYF
jgi:hypothetical protein